MPKTLKELVETTRGWMHDLCPEPECEEVRLWFEQLAGYLEGYFDAKAEIDH